MKLSGCSWRCWKNRTPENATTWIPCSTCAAIALALAESRADVEARLAALHADREEAVALRQQWAIDADALESERDELRAEVARLTAVNEQLVGCPNCGVHYKLAMDLRAWKDHPDEWERVTEENKSLKADLSRLTAAQEARDTQIAELTSQVQRRDSVFWPSKTEEEGHLYEIRNGINQEYVDTHVAALKELWLARLRASQTWLPIERFNGGDEEALFWIVPKTPEEAYCNTSGDPIFGTFTPYIFKGKFKTWSSLSKAIYFWPLPASPEEPTR